MSTLASRLPTETRSGFIDRLLVVDKAGARHFLVRALTLSLDVTPWLEATAIKLGHSKQLFNLVTWHFMPLVKHV